MINTIIGYDDEDLELGEYFENSHADLLSEISKIPIVANNSLRGLDCNVPNLTAVIQPFNGQRFVFIALAHGNEDEIVANEVFVSADNASSFSNTLFYSCACSTGYTLGNVLISAGCLVFIGYCDTVCVIEEESTVFYSCQNFGIKSFLTNDEAISVSYDKMIGYYDQEIDRLVGGTTDDVIVAAELINNRDCMVILGNVGLTRSDFHLN